MTQDRILTLGLWQHCSACTDWTRISMWWTEFSVEFEDTQKNVLIMSTYAFFWLGREACSSFLHNFHSLKTVHLLKTSPKKVVPFMQIQLCQNYRIRSEGSRLCSTLSGHSSDDPDECLALVNSTDNGDKDLFVCLEHVCVVSLHQFLWDSRPKQWETLPWRSCMS